MANFTSTPSDFNQDGHVDQDDVGHFAACASGPSIPQTDPNCKNSDLDGDGANDVVWGTSTPAHDHLDAKLVAGDPGDGGRDLLEDLQSFAAGVVLEVGEARHVAAGTREARHQTGLRAHLSRHDAHDRTLRECRELGAIPSDDMPRTTRAPRGTGSRKSG